MRENNLNIKLPSWFFLTVIQPAISEYEKMKMKFEIEYNCRAQAEILASKVN